MEREGENMIPESNHRRALCTIGIAAVLDVIFGLVFAVAAHVSAGMGLFYATSTATTAGSAPVVLRGWLPYTLTVLIMLTVIPLFSACFSLFTAGLTATHVDQRHDEQEAAAGRRHEEMKAHIAAHTSTDGNSS